MMWEVAFDVRCELGEGPIYDARENELIWFDIIGQKLFIASLATQHITQHSFDEPVSAAFLSDAGSLCLWQVPAGYIMCTEPAVRRC
jgi:sugar lactone lactonase YvrE